MRACMHQEVHKHELELELLLYASSYNVRTRNLVLNTCNGNNPELRPPPPTFSPPSSTQVREV